MTRFLYYVFLLPLSYLPWSLIYAISNLLSFLLYRVLRYRGKVIFSNLRASFPEKSKPEIEKIGKEFYRHFTDQWMETLKLFSISRKTAIERCKLINPELLDKYKNQHIICVLGHHNNWEMAAVALDPQVEHQTIAIYKQVKDPFLDKVILESRSKFGMKMISTEKAKKTIVEETDAPSIVFFVADQSGLTSKKVYWLPFLNQDTAVVTGPERFSKMLDSPVVFMKIHKMKRGRYKLEFEDILSKPKESEEGEITVRHAKVLEAVIRASPEYWLWSHKRWKKGRLPHNQIRYDLEGIYKKLGLPMDEMKVSSPTGYQEVQ